MPGSSPRPVPGFLFAMNPSITLPCIPRRNLSFRRFLSYRSLRAVRDGRFAGRMANYRHGVYVVELGS